MNKNASKFYDPFSALNKSVKNDHAKELFKETIVSKHFLVCKENNKKVIINKPIFKIGKQATTCDYVVDNNKYVGREHAMIVVENETAYFIDNNSTNKSYINGKQIAPNQKTILKNNDEIKLANVYFTYVIE